MKFGVEGFFDVGKIVESSESSDIAILSDLPACRRRVGIRITYTDFRRDIYYENRYNAKGISKRQDYS